ncbi:universal stress protein [Lentilactobacillus farraginis]|uniref:Universal stress protein n=1 Tax=Lentilactobacillus farraginis DSM 18382 = JCM 14108 TaxID=1423743 RepID=X0QAK6_9LACO|nr:universal stress protein [Lentilactobacillus farraginis]KRM11098.1 universal stress protein UspA [Lentilactobacillus farraginis DSM 18382 = JCM 14108]GAF35635.1 universal stress protein family [Lentilactobacillus farraginis DSM 18382 = JCM 14108]
MYETILVPVDGSENSKQAVEEAAKLAKQFGSTLQIVSVASDQRYVQYGVTLGQDVMQSFQERAEEILDDARETVEKMGVKVETHFVVGIPKIQIAKELPKKYNASLIVMGKSGVNGISRAILGSTTAYVVRHSTVNVMVIDYPKK